MDVNKIPPPKTLQRIPNFLYVSSSFSELPNLKFAKTKLHALLVLLTISFSVQKSDSQTSLLNEVVAKDAFAVCTHQPEASTRDFYFSTLILTVERA